MSLKLTEELCVIKIKNDAKFEEKLTYGFEIDMTYLTNLTQVIESVKRLNFNSKFFDKSIQCLS